jgi:hypothetical protein
MSSLKKDCDEYITSLTDGILSPNVKLEIDKKYLDCFNEPGNCFTLSNGKKICIPDGIANINLSDAKQTTQSSSGFKNYKENFTESINDDTVNVNFSIENPNDKNLSAPSTTKQPINNDQVQTNLCESDFAELSNKIEKKILDDIEVKTREKKIINDVVDGVNDRIKNKISYYDNKTTFSPNNPYSNVQKYVQDNSDKLETELSDSRAQARVESKKQIYNNNNNSNNQPQQILRPNNNSIFQAGGMSVKQDYSQPTDNNGIIPSMSSYNTKVVFPDSSNGADSYSYYGALQPKGSDYAPMNSISETNKMLGRLDYAPPPLPPNMDFSYFGALRNKGTDDAKPVNALQGLNNYSEKILDDNLYSIAGKMGVQEFPIPNRIDYTMYRPEINTDNVNYNSSQPIDLYSQYGALVSKDKFYDSSRG